MKTKILQTGKEINLPEAFSSSIREDIAQRCYEIEKRHQPFAPFLDAGKLAAASGKVRHARKVWKTQYGKGMSRTPQKQMWRRGTQFYWRGAIVVQSVGGRRAHPPRVEHFEKILSINKKEKEIAFNSGITATASEKYVKKRYERLNSIKIENLPLIADSSILKMNAKKFFEFLKKNLGNLYEVSLQEKNKRAGKVKMRIGNRKSAGLLLVIGNSEKFRMNGIDVRKVDELEMQDFYPLGRVTLYTENAIKDIETREKKEIK